MTIAARIGAIALDADRRAKAAGFVQHARCLIAGNGDRFAALAEARRARVTQPVIEAIETITKASVAQATTTDSTWAAPLFNTQFSDAFGETLRDVSAFDRLLAEGMLRVPPSTKVAVVTAGVSGATVGEAMVKPAGRLATTQVEVTMKKSVAFVIVTRELMRMSSPGSLALLQRELRGSVASVTDTTFIDDLTTGISTIPSSGGTALGMRADLRAAADAIDTGAASRLFWIAPSSIVKRLSVIGDSAGSAAFPEVADGRLGPWPLVTSDGVGSGLLILVDAAQVAAAALPIELDAADQASVQLDTAPDSPPSAATNMVSLWAMNMGAVRCTRYFGIKRLRDTGVAVVANVAATGNSPS